LNPLKGLKFRSIGPAVMGGRVDDFAVVDSDPLTFYVGTAAGGVLKTTNGGTTWEHVFDEVGSPSIGDVTLAPSNSAIIYVGTGEANNRQSSSWGNGVYKSMDAGKTWKHQGLQQTHHIGRIVVHPTNPDLVYVAARGDLWGPNPERGVFMSTDGGATWNKTLYIDDDTGVSDIAIDPHSPNVLYAAAYMRRRTVFGYNGGGPKSGLYRSLDGGRTWEKLTKGLPTTGDVGRCAVEVFRKNSNIVYALIEHMTQGGVYRPMTRVPPGRARAIPTRDHPTTARSASIPITRTRSGCSVRRCICPRTAVAPSPRRAATEFTATITPCGSIRPMAII
jgi:hypothetical protein